MLTNPRQDPQDPEHHPIREIVEVPARLQCAKLLRSAVMYSLDDYDDPRHALLVWKGHYFSTAMASWVRRLVPYSVLSSLLCAGARCRLYLMITYSLCSAHRCWSTRYSRQLIMRRAFLSWGKSLARQFRLTSFFYGLRESSEEGEGTHWSWLAAIFPRLGPRPTHNAPLWFRNGHLARVPLI